MAPTTEPCAVVVLFHRTLTCAAMLLIACGCAATDNAMTEHTEPAIPDSGDGPTAPPSPQAVPTSTQSPSTSDDIGLAPDKNALIPEGVAQQLDVLLGAEPGWLCTNDFSSHGQPIVVIDADGDAGDALIPGNGGVVCIVDVERSEEVAVTVEGPHDTLQRLVLEPSALEPEERHYGFSLSLKPLAPPGTYTIRASQGDAELLQEFVVEPPARVFEVVDHVDTTVEITDRPALLRYLKPRPSFTAAGYQPNEFLSYFVYRSTGKTSTSQETGEELTTFGPASYVGTLAVLADEDGRAIEDLTLERGHYCYWVLEAPPPSEDLTQYPHFCVRDDS